MIPAFALQCYLHKLQSNEKPDTNPFAISELILLLLLFFRAVLSLAQETYLEKHKKRQWRRFDWVSSDCSKLSCRQYLFICRNLLQGTWNNWVQDYQFRAIQEDKVNRCQMKRPPSFPLPKYCQRPSYCDLLWLVPVINASLCFASEFTELTFGYCHHLQEFGD